MTHVRNMENICNENDKRVDDVVCTGENNVCKAYEYNLKTSFVHLDKN